jgi:hypothetical protein
MVPFQKYMAKSNLIFLQIFQGNSVVMNGKLVHYDKRVVKCGNDT